MVFGLTEDERWATLHTGGGDLYSPQPLPISTGRVLPLSGVARSCRTWSGIWIWRPLPMSTVGVMSGLPGGRLFWGSGWYGIPIWQTWGPGALPR